MLRVPLHVGGVHVPLVPLVQPRGDGVEPPVDEDPELGLVKPARHPVVVPQRLPRGLKRAGIHRLRHRIGVGRTRRRAILTQRKVRQPGSRQQATGSGKQTSTRKGHAATLHLGGPPGSGTLSLVGEMAEWLKAHAWKACIPQGIQGSNPCLSAIKPGVLAPGWPYVRASKSFHSSPCICPPDRCAREVLQTIHGAYYGSPGRKAVFSSVGEHARGHHPDTGPAGGVLPADVSFAQDRRPRNHAQAPAENLLSDLLCRP